MQNSIKYMTSIKAAAVLIAALALALAAWFNTPVTHAQPPCESFEALGQMLIPTTRPLATGHRWGGEIYIKMGDEYLQGLISGSDGEVVLTPNTGHGRGGLYVLGFNCTPDTPHWTCEETINIPITNSIFGPTVPIFDRDQGNSSYINGGTGRFQYATGNVTISGPYIVWNTGGTPPRNGRYNPEIKGHICGVQ